MTIRREFIVVGAIALALAPLRDVGKTARHAQAVPGRQVSALVRTILSVPVRALSYVVLEEDALDHTVRLDETQMRALRSRLGGLVHVSRPRSDTACLAAAKGPDTTCEVIQLGSYTELGDTVKVRATWLWVGPDGSPRKCTSSEEYIVMMTFKNDSIIRAGRQNGVSSDSFCH